MILANKSIYRPFSYLCLLLALLAFNSCEDVIDVELDPAEAQLVVDAWLNDQSSNQIIRLTQSQAYFDNTAVTGLAGATVQVTRDDGLIFDFTDTGNGNYVWTPGNNTTIGTPGNSYTLNIAIDGKSYQSTATMNPVPPVDSINYEFRDDELGGPDGIYAEFFARDLPGLGNAYWIKAYKNGDFLNKPAEINLAYDAGFDPGAQVDGLIFITPIREAINRIPDEDGDDNSDVAPWANGDLIRVEIHSLNTSTFSFMELARDQITNGDNGIFALPLANTSGNVFEVGSGNKALGVFNVASISSLEEMVEE